MAVSQMYCCAGKVGASGVVEECVGEGCFDGVGLTVALQPVKSDRKKISIIAILRLFERMLNMTHLPASISLFCAAVYKQESKRGN